MNSLRGRAGQPALLYIMRNTELENINLAKARSEAKEAGYNAMAAQYKALLIGQQLRPSFSIAVDISHDGLRWKCQAVTVPDAVSFGDTPAEALSAFDLVWNGKANASVDG